MSYLKDPLWARLTSLSFTLFFIFLGDAILSFWVPNFLQESFGGNAFLMGLVISFSSIIGFIADMILPQLIKGIQVNRLLMMAVIVSLIFSGILIGSTFFPFMLIFLLAMAFWGIYYEFLGFANHQFIADSVPHELHSSAWAFVSSFKNLAYFIGPMIGGWLVIKSDRSPLVLAITFSLIGLFMIISSRKIHNREVEIDFKEVSLMKEIEHWTTLFRYVWPIVLLSLFLALIDATFWTSGAVLTEELSKKAWYGVLFLPLYVLPSLLVSYIVIKRKIFEGKKKWAIRFTLLSGVFLAALGISQNLLFLLAMSLISSTFLAFAYPLLDGAYSDIIARMGRQRKHLIGLSGSSISLAYIIGPALAGLIAKLVGEAGSFSVMGIALFLVCLILMIVTPKKIKLPQQEIQTWKD